MNKRVASGASLDHLKAPIIGHFCRLALYKRRIAKNSHIVLSFFVKSLLVETRKSASSSNPEGNSRHHNKNLLKHIIYLLYMVRNQEMIKMAFICKY